jgi:hypothetical protein
LYVTGLTDSALHALRQRQRQPLSSSPNALTPSSLISS